MPRYEHADSNKYWEYVVLEARLFTRYGSADSKGKAAVVDFDCPAKARKAANKRKKEKLAKGYKIVPEKRKKARVEKRNPELEAVLFESPDDADSYAVYSDWLQTEGEPRGEIIAVHNAVSENPEDKHLQMHLARLMYAARAQMFPPLLYKELDKARKDVASDEFCQASWAHGFIRSARVGGIWANSKASAAEIIRELLDHNSGRFLSELRIASLYANAGNPYAAVIKTLGECGQHLRTLHLAEVPDEVLADVDLGDLEGIFTALPKLEALHLGASALRLREFGKETLRALSLSSPVIAKETLQAVAGAEWPELTSLHIDFHHQDVDWSALVPIFDGAAPKLESLTLSRTLDTAVIWKALCKSKCLEGLLELSVVDGDLEDSSLSSGVVERLAHLGSLHLDRHHLSEAVVEEVGGQLKGTFSAALQRPKGARAPLTEANVLALTSQSNFKRGKALAKPNKWSTLGKQGDLLWGQFQGSDFYEAFARFGEDDEIDSACTCPSQFYPCKHILGLLLIEVQQHEFPDEAPPPRLVQNAENERYASVYE